MEIYEIGYWSYEDSSKTLLTNDKPYTQDQFNDLVSDIIADIGVVELELYGDFRSRFDDLIEPIVLSLINDFNFKEVKPKVKLRPFGWSSLTENDWKHDISKDDDINILREKLREKLHYN